MSENKKIPCRVCGKLFEPCSYCQSHKDVFRWRNFACSRECATKYINTAIEYRKTSKMKEIKTSDLGNNNEPTVRRKNNKKTSECIDSKHEKNTTE